MAKLIFDIFRKILVFWTLKHQKTCIWDVFRAWDYARTISRSKMLHIACPKTDIGAPKIHIWHFKLFACMLYVFYVCMYSVHVLYACILCIPCMYVVHEWTGRTEPFRFTFLLEPFEPFRFTFFPNERNSVEILFIWTLARRVRNAHNSLEILCI